MAPDDRTPGIPAHVLIEHAGFVRSVARAILTCDADADDAAQEALTKGLTTGPSNSAARRSWLAAVVRNAARGIYRREGRRAVHEGEAARSGEAESALDAALKAETIERVGEAVAGLEEPERTAVVLRHYDDLPPRDIAARLGVPVATVNSRLLRAHARLRSRLEEGDSRERDRRRRALAAFAGLSLLAPSSAGAAAGVTTGGAIMGLTAKSMMVAAVALLALSVGVYLVFPGDGPPAAPPQAEGAAQADAGPKARPPQLEARPALPMLARGSSTITGFVRRRGIPEAARVEVRRSPYVNALAATTAETLEMWAGGLRPAPSPMATATSGADGRFALSIAGTGYLEALAIASDGALGFAFVEIPAEGARVETSIDLLDGSHTLHGRVAYADGRPWTGQVTAVGDRVTSRYLHGPAVSTDEGGRFVVAGLPTGGATVTAFRSGEMRAARTGVPIPYAGEYVLVVDEGLTALAGNVIDDADGKPIGGAVVALSTTLRRQDFGASFSRTGPDGAFSIPWIGGSSDHLSAAADGYAGLMLYARDIRQPLVIRLARAASVAGRVLRAADGAPVVGARVQVLSLHDGTRGIALTETTSGGDGRYEVPGLPPGEFAVVASAPGLRSPMPSLRSHGDWSSLAVSLVAGAKGVRDVPLVSAASVAGRVVDADGRAVVGAIVRIDKIDEQAAWTAGLSYKDVAEASDEKGGYSVDGLPAGASASFSATAPGLPPATAGPVSLGTAGLIPLDIRFPPARRIDVLVLDDASGSPIAGAFTRATPTSGIGVVEAVSDAAGRAALVGLPADVPLIDVRATGHGSVRRPRPADGGTLTVRLAPGRVLSGTVVGADGSPVGGAWVSVWFEETGNALANAQAGADGSFRFEDLPDMDLTVRANGEGGLEAKEGARPGRDVTLRLGPRSPPEHPGRLAMPTASAAPREKSGAFVGLVVDPDGHPVPKASVRLATETGGWGNYANDGRAVFDRAPQGEAVFEAWGARNAYGVALPYGPVRVAVLDGATEVQARLMPEAAVEGRVIAPDGSGARGVQILASWPDHEKDVRMNPYPASALGAARTDEEGHFRVGGLAVEAVVLIVVTPEGAAPVPAVAIRGGARGVEIRLRPGIAPRLLVVDSEGKPLEHAQISIRDGERSALSEAGPPRQTDFQGAFQCDSLDPGVEYRLAVTPERNRPDLVAYVVTKWTPKSETIRMPRACTLRGVVVDAAGRAVSKALVERVFGDGDAEGDRREGGAADVQTARVDADGRFEMRGVPEGAARLRASIPQGLPRSEATVAASVNGGDITLTIDLGLEFRVRITGWADAGGGGGRHAYLFEGVPEKGAAYGMFPIGADGAVVCRGLRRDLAYTVWVPPSGSDTHVLRDGVRWSAEEAIVALTPGLSIVGRLAAPPHVTGKIQVWARRGGLNVIGVADADGRYEIHGLPPGDWTVLAMAWGPGGELRGEAPAPAGGSVDFELKKAPLR